MDSGRIAEIRERCEAATPGPWLWRIGVQNRNVELIANDGLMSIVMDYARWGMNRATPRFSRVGLLHNASEFTKPKPDYEHHAKWDSTIDHEDAQFIAHARQDVPDLLNALDAANAKIASMRDSYAESIGHYREEIRLLRKQRDEARALIVELDEAFDTLDSIANAYPEEVFPEPDWIAVREALEAHNISMDCVSAGNMRVVAQNVGRIIAPLRREVLRHDR